MPNNKKKTLKQIKKKESVIHPSSRKAAQLQRAFLRKDRLDKTKLRRYSESVRPIVDRILWFKYALDDSIPCATKADIYDLIEMYISRNDDELSKIKSLKMNGAVRPKTVKEDLIEALKLKEQKEYIEGFEIPDLMNAKNVKILREWDGDPNSLSRIKLIRVEDPKNAIDLKATVANLKKMKLNKGSDKSQGEKTTKAMELDPDIIIKN
ncbi:translation machinery-associated protein 16 [Gigaspora margarita]|uniref:Translation machinery-associated protein 16 n=1 Tax=Gigaspora margarita TaxID=4874 RepID=A0A8H4EU43_GIGMA|nr:translation machinery-associated protein 16 [Gigaspora margarita]